MSRRIDLSHLPPVFGLALPYHVTAKVASEEFYVFRPGAFSDVAHNITLHFNHDQSTTLASTNSGTLHLYDEPEGLYFGVTAEDGGGNWLASLVSFVERGAVRGASINWFAQYCDEEVREFSHGRLHVVHRAALALNEMSLCCGVDPKFAGTWVATKDTPGVEKHLPEGHRRWRTLAALAEQQVLEDQIALTLALTEGVLCAN